MKGFTSLYRGIELEVKDSGSPDKAQLDAFVCECITKYGGEPELLHVSNECYAELWRGYFIDYAPTKDSYTVFNTTKDGLIERIRGTLEFNMNTCHIQDWESIADYVLSAIDIDDQGE